MMLEIAFKTLLCFTRFNFSGGVSLDSFQYISYRRSQRLPEEAGAADLHQVPDPRAGEGVPLQPLSHAAPQDRDRPRAVPHGAPDQDLVPEQEDEAQEGAEGGQGDQRAGEEEAGRW